METMSDRIPPEIVLIGEVGTGVEFQGVQGEDFLLAIGEREKHKTKDDEEYFFHRTLKLAQR